MKPTFYIAGAPKCGTTSWAAYLAEHPMVCMSDPKEPNFFSTDLRTAQNRVAASIGDYERLFRASPGHIQFGEATPLYLYSSDAMQAMSAYTPDARIILLLREPVSFFRSLHQQFLYRRLETLEDPREAWERSGLRDLSGQPDGAAIARHLDYKALGDFNAQVRRVLEHFPPEQVFLTWMEDWKGNPRWLYEELAAFLQIDASVPIAFEVHNAAKRHRSVALSRLTIRPPKTLVAAAGAVKKVLGVKRLGVVSALRELNTSHDVPKTLDPDLARDIAAFYRAGLESLDSLSRDTGILRKPPA